ncbi:MAG: hypothetical protein IJD33_06070 [Clostridia bacterium]|nr:hypothetical protein [Clostridia bacterium]
MRFTKIIEYLDKMTDGNGLVCAAAILGGVLLLLAVVVACLCKKEKVYVCVAFPLVVGIECVMFATDTALKTGMLFRTIAWLSVGVCWLFTTLTIFFSRRALRKKKSLMVSAKASALLPEKDNSYVRARLHTALRGDDISAEERKYVPYENRGAVRLGYVRRLLASMQDAPLLPAERLELESLSREFENYALSEKWNATQLRAVNELFARLLKLAAKYSVED